MSLAGGYSTSARNSRDQVKSRYYTWLQFIVLEGKDSKVAKESSSICGNLRGNFVDVFNFSVANVLNELSQAIRVDRNIDCCKVRTLGKCS